MQQAVYVQTLARSFDLPQASITLENDNMPAIDMMRALGANKRSKFIDVRHQYLKQIVCKNNIQLQHVPSKKLRADLFTKALDLVRFTRLQNEVHVHEIPNITADIMDDAGSDHSPGGV